MTELAIFCIVVGLVCLAGVAVDQYIVRSHVRRAVFEHLDDMASNGYAIEYLQENEPHHIANHLLYSANDLRLQGISTNRIARYVRAWLYHRGIS